jgi:hypothetical protein
MRKPVLQVLHPRRASNLIASRIRIFHASMLLPTVSSGRISHFFWTVEKEEAESQPAFFTFLPRILEPMKAQKHCGGSLYSRTFTH